MSSPHRLSSTSSLARAQTRSRSLSPPAPRLTLSKRFSRSLQRLFGRFSASITPSQSTESIGSLPSSDHGRLSRSLDDVAAWSVNASIVTSTCSHCGRETRALAWGYAPPTSCACRHPASAKSNSSTSTSETTTSSVMGALHYAAARGKSRAVLALLSSGTVAVDHRDAEGLTAFGLSVLSSQFKVQTCMCSKITN